MHGKTEPPYKEKLLLYTETYTRTTCEYTLKYMPTCELTELSCIMQFSLIL